MSADQLSIIIGLITGTGFYMYLSRLMPDKLVDAGSLLRSIRATWDRIRSTAGWSADALRDWPPSARNTAKLIVVGLALLVLAYPLTFTTRSFSIYGRETRVHFAAILGFSMLWATAVLSVLALPGGRARKRLLTAGVALLLGLWVSFALDVQRDYAQAWQLQRSFWTSAVRLIGDVDDGTAVLVEPEGLQDTLHIGANTWNLARILGQIYAFPPDWADVPRVYRLLPNWEDDIVDKSDQFRLSNLTVNAPPSTYKAVPSTQIIIVESARGVLTRVPETVLVGEREYRLKEEGGDTLSLLPEGILYDFLIEAD